MAALVISGLSKWALKKALTSLGGKAGSDLLGRVWSLMFDEKEDFRNIERMLDKIALELSSVRIEGVRRDFETNRKNLFVDLGIIRDSYSKNSDTNANLQMIADRYVPMGPGSFYRYLSYFLAEIVGWSSASTSEFNAFAVTDPTYKDGMIRWYSSYILNKSDISFDEYINKMNEFTAPFIAALGVLSETYATGLAALKKHNRINSDVTIIPRWTENGGMLADVLPVITDCLRTVCYPVMELAEI
jgi:hypothetical protein